MRVVTDGAGLRAAGCGRGQGVFVPTMGALHEGHLALVRQGVAMACSPVVVSIFVNPTQFNDPKDLERYPRTLEADVAGCAAAGADVVFAPSVEAVYPEGTDSSPPPLPSPPPPPRLPPVAIEPGLEDAARPGHFAGVCQVVARLFHLVGPEAAIFGEKDWQQLRVVSAMTEAEGLGVRIIAAPTVREADGLAMSSRNRFLTPSGRARSLSLSRALCEACAEETVVAAEARMRAIVESAGMKVEYAVVRDARTLMPVDEHGAGDGRAMRALIAARFADDDRGLSTVRGLRLIDNAPWGGRMRQPRGGCSVRQ